MSPNFTNLCLRQVKKSAVRSVLHVGGWSLHTKISFSSYPVLLANTIFSPFAYVSHACRYTDGQTHTNRFAMFHTQRQLIWSARCVLKVISHWCLALMRAPGCCVRLSPQPEHCSLKQLSFWLIQNRWHVHVGLLGCTYVQASACASETEREEEERRGSAVRLEKKEKYVCVYICACIVSTTSSWKGLSVFLDSSTTMQ